ESSGNRRRTELSSIPLPPESIAEDEDDPSGSDTADGRPATIEFARARLARMLCCDRSELNDEQLLDIARQVRAAQIQTLAPVVSKIVSGLPQPPQSVLLCGEGEGLLREVLDHIPQLSGAQRVSLNEALG